MPARVGIVGCGVISDHYAKNAAAFPSFDIVLNITPPVAHFEITRQAPAARKHVYSEKPLALTIADASGLVAEAERNEVRLSCAPDTFLSGAFKAARAVLDSGQIGEPLSVSGAMFGAGHGDWRDLPFVALGRQDARGIGLHDLVEAIAEARPLRASADLACHVVDVARTILAAAEAGDTLAVGTTIERPANDDRAG